MTMPKTPRGPKVVERAKVAESSDRLRRPKATKPTVKVLEALLERPTEERYGFDLLQQTKLKSGSLYPILIRFEKLGWLESSWEETDRKGPRRRLYSLTAEGEPAARQFVLKARGQAGQKFAAGFRSPLPAGGASA